MLCAVLVSLAVSQQECPRPSGVRYGLGKPGDVCSSDTECMNYMVTGSSNLKRYICYENRCRGLLDNGMRCTANTQCQGGVCGAADSVALQAQRLTCATAGTFAAGSFCTEDIYCSSDFFCKAGKCTKRPQPGEVCYIAQGNQRYTCVVGSGCIVPSVSTVQTAVCTTLKPVGTTGDSCSSVMKCSYLDYCRKLSTVQTCQPLKTNEACYGDGECQAGYGCNQNTCTQYFSVAQGGGAERNIFCKIGLSAYNARCTAPLNLNAPCSSDTDCTLPQDGGLLVCSCTTGGVGTCTYILPQACNDKAQRYAAYEEAKYNQADYASLQKDYLCCLRDNLDEDSPTWYLSDLGRYDTSNLGCSSSSVPGWVIVLIVLAVVVCCLILLVTAKLMSDKEEVTKEERVTEERVEEHGSEPASPTPARTLDTPVKEGRKEDYDTKELEAELRNLAALNSYRVNDPGGGPRGVHIDQKPFCDNFANCTHLDNHSHLEAFMHQCSVRECPLALDAAHCTYYWHILPSCLDPHCANSDAGHFLKHRHYCPEGITCSNLSDPVHQQLFRHVSRENPLLAFDKM